MEHEQHSMNIKPYKKLIIMAVLSFIFMYILMYSMADKITNIYPNINQFYMAGLMSMPMIIIELLLMGHMYKDKRMNAIIFAISGFALIGFFLSIRQQVAVSERQFLKGMIPHHAAAILMSKENPAQDPEIVKLQQEIISSQEREIAQMKAILERTGNK